MPNAVIVDAVRTPVGRRNGRLSQWHAVDLAAAFPDTVPGTTVDRQCGSAQQAVHFAAQAVMAGAMDVVIGAGVESMSRVPIGSTTDPGPGEAYGPLYRERFQ